MKHFKAPNAGFSLVEVTIAVVVLGVTGLAMLDGLQSNLLQSRKIEVRANSDVALARAVDLLRAAKFTSCSTSPQPYGAPSDGITLTVQEFISAATPQWQDCRNVTTKGSAQRISVTASDGTTQTLLRFDSVMPTGTPTQSVTLAATATASPSSVCNSFRGSKSGKTCTITITNTAGSGQNWHITAITFGGGSFFNPAPTAAISQSSQIVFSTYLLDGGVACPSGSAFPMTIQLLDDGNNTTTTVAPVLTC